MDYQMPIRHTVVMTDATAQKVVDAAIPELLAWRYDVARYEAGVGACHYVVGFIERGSKLGEDQTGNPGSIPGIEVTLSGETLKIVATGLIR